MLNFFLYVTECLPLDSFFIRAYGVAWWGLFEHVYTYLLRIFMWLEVLHFVIFRMMGEYRKILNLILAMGYMVNWILDLISTQAMKISRMILKTSCIIPKLMQKLALMKTPGQLRMHFQKVDQMIRWWIGTTCFLSQHWLCLEFSTKCLFVAGRD